MTPIGSEYQEMLDELVVRWQAGEVSNLEAALAALDQAIDEKIRVVVAELGRSRAA
jgi:hypothetical protein